MDCSHFNAFNSNEERPYLTKIGRETLNFKSGLDWPEGGWQKGATTTLLLDTWLYSIISFFNAALVRFQNMLLGSSFLYQFFTDSKKEWLETLLSDEIIYRLAGEDDRIPLIALATNLACTLGSGFLD